MKKDGYNKNPVGDKGSSPSRSSLSQDEGKGRGEKNTRDGAKQSLQHFLIPCHHRELKDMQELPKRMPPDKRPYSQRHDNKSRYPQRNRMGQTSQIAWARLEKFAEKFGTHSENVRDIDKAKNPQ